METRVDMNESMTKPCTTLSPSYLDVNGNNILPQAYFKFSVTMTDNQLVPAYVTNNTSQQSNTNHQFLENNNSEEDQNNNNNCIPQQPKLSNPNMLDLGAPPPYTPTPYTPPYASAPPCYDENARAIEQHHLMHSNTNDDYEKEDLDFFKYTIPCKRIATYVSVCVGLIVIVVILLLLIFGKM